MGPLSWIILGALIGGIAFCLFKIKAWAQALATFRVGKVKSSHKIWKWRNNRG